MKVRAEVEPEWSDGPMVGPVGPRLVAATGAELRLLGNAAASLWRALIRERAACKLAVADEWWAANLSRLAWAARLSYRTAKRALADLRRAGLVSTWWHTETRWSRLRSTGRIESVTARTSLSYLVPGAAERNGAIMFPARQWREFVSARRAGWTRSALRIKPWRPSEPMAVWRREWTAEIVASLRPENDPKNEGKFSGFRSQATDLPAKMAPLLSRIENKDKKKKQSSHPPAAARPDGCGSADSFSFSQAEPAQAHGRELTKAEAGAECMAALQGLFNSEACRQGDGPTRDGPAPWREPDRPPKPVALVGWIAGKTPADRAREVADGFRAAVRKVYGQPWHGYSRGDITKSKLYRSFVDCARAMEQHSVPPKHWAIWKLTWLKANAPKFADKPPPIHVVMSPKRVAEQAGWFRKAYSLPVAVHVTCPVYREQRYRNLEAARLHYGRNEIAIWLRLPQWYYDMRQAEIAAGHVAPHDIWPLRTWGYDHKDAWSHDWGDHRRVYQEQEEEPKKK